jgi:uncharacterized protein YceK
MLSGGGGAGVQAQSNAPLAIARSVRPLEIPFRSLLDTIFTPE